MTRPTKSAKINLGFGVRGPHWAAGYHTGIDYAAEVGDPIFATRKGKVVYSGWDNSYGNYVVVQTWHYYRFIRHLYAHLSKRRVGLGKKVIAGEVVGWAGNTGNSTGPHLHYEERHHPFGYYDHHKPVLPFWQPKSKKVLNNILKRIGVKTKK